MTAPQKLLTPQEVAEYLDVPLRTIYYWRVQHTGPRASKVGIHIRYRLADVDKWLDQQAEAAA